MKSINPFSILVMSVLLLGSASQASQVKIKATLGEKTNQFLIRSSGKGFYIEHKVQGDTSQKVSIDEPNFEFVMASAQKVIRLAKESKIPSEPCLRDQADIEVTHDSDVSQGARVCLLSKQSASKALLELMNVLGMALK